MADILFLFEWKLSSFQTLYRSVDYFIFQWVLSYYHINHWILWDHSNQQSCFKQYIVRTIFRQRAILKLAKYSDCQEVDVFIVVLESLSALSWLQKNYHFLTTSSVNSDTFHVITFTSKFHQFYSDYNVNLRRRSFVGMPSILNRQTLYIM